MWYHLLTKSENALKILTSISYIYDIHQILIVRINSSNYLSAYSSKHVPYQKYADKKMGFIYSFFDICRAINISMVRR